MSQVMPKKVAEQEGGDGKPIATLPARHSTVVESSDDLTTIQQIIKMIGEGCPNVQGY